MSNKATLVATKFENIACTMPPTYGFRIYDSYVSAYDNMAEGPITDDLELMEWAIKNHTSTDGSDPIAELLADLKLNEDGIEINGSWYEFEDFSHLFG